MYYMHKEARNRVMIIAKSDPSETKITLKIIIIITDKRKRKINYKLLSDRIYHLVGLSATVGILFPDISLRHSGWELVMNF